MSLSIMTKSADSKNLGKNQKSKSKPPAKQKSKRLGSVSSTGTGPKPLSANVSTQTNIPSTNSTIPPPKDARLVSEASVQKLINSPGIGSDYLVIAQPQFSELHLVTDNIYLTGMFGLTKEKFEKLHIISKSNASKRKEIPSLIVNATKELPNLIDYNCIRVNVDDDRSEDIYPHLNSAVDKMYDTVSKDGKVVVHCMAGVSRSAAIVIAYLIKYRKMTLRRAYTSVVKARPVSRPNSSFLVQLIKFEADTMGTTSTKIIRVRKNGIVVELPDFLFFDLPQKFEEEFSHNRAMNRVIDAGPDNIHSEYPLYDLDKGDTIPTPGTGSSHSSGQKTVKSNESF